MLPDLLEQLDALGVRVVYFRVWITKLTDPGTGGAPRGRFQNEARTMPAGDLGVFGEGVQDHL